MTMEDPMTTNVTDYNPPSQGGTRKELLAKFAKTGLPEDARAARMAGATQNELQETRLLWEARQKN